MQHTSFSGRSLLLSLHTLPGVDVVLAEVAWHVVADEIQILSLPLAIPEVS